MKNFTVDSAGNANVGILNKEAGPQRPALFLGG